MIDVRLADSAWEGVDEGTEALVECWLVSEGSRVCAGQTLATVMIIKTSVDVVAPTSGVVRKILVPAFATVGRGQALGVLQEDAYRV